MQIHNWKYNKVRKWKTYQHMSLFSFKRFLLKHVVRNKRFWLFKLLIDYHLIRLLIYIHGAPFFYFTRFIYYFSTFYLFWIMSPFEYLFLFINILTKIQWILVKVDEFQIYICGGRNRTMRQLNKVKMAKGFLIHTMYNSIFLNIMEALIFILALSLFSSCCYIYHPHKLILLSFIHPLLMWAKIMKHILIG